jgi:hypothetical protein
MQILGLARSTQKMGRRLKTLLWPTIRTRVDLDTVTTQGFCICALMGCVMAAAVFLAIRELLQILRPSEATFSALAGIAMWPAVTGALAVAFILLAGIGSRMRSRFAATAAFAAVLLDAAIKQIELGTGFGVMRLVLLALLLANVRGTWLAASFHPSESDLPPIRHGGTWRSKLADQWPAAIWPWGRYLFYLLAGLGPVLMAWSVLEWYE